MKTLNLILCSILLMMSSCNAQEKKDTGEELSLNASTAAASDPLNKPDVRFKVNKRYDEKGNVISYDSTYSYTYSGPGQMDLDMKNMFGDFKTHFGNSPLSFFNFPGATLAPGDSTLAMPFEEAYFRKHMEINQKMMNELFQHFNLLQQPGAMDKKSEKTTGKKI